MKKIETLGWLNHCLIDEMPQYRKQAESFPPDEDSQWQLFRSLVNVRPPKEAGEEFLRIQDTLLQEEIGAKGITKMEDLQPARDGLYLWQGDITTLGTDGIVNAANSGMTCCYVPCHGCIDNAIHTFAGVQLRLACAKLMDEQGFEEPAGRAKVTEGYNLPCRYVIHTVGPIVRGKVTEKDRTLLASCYRSCLAAAVEWKMKSVAFCCISTGEFHFPNEEAAEIAVETVREVLRAHPELMVVFNVFQDRDREIYERLLKR